MKLGVVVKNFKIRQVGDFSDFWSKSSLFKHTYMAYLPMGGLDGVSKVSFNFVYTLRVYRSCIYVLICIVKNFHQDTYGFQNFMSSWGVGVMNFENNIA